MGVSVELLIFFDNILRVVEIRVEILTNILILQITTIIHRSWFQFMVLHIH